MAGPAGPYLEKIIAKRRERLQEARARAPLRQLEQAAERRHERRQFAAALSHGGPRPDYAGPRVIAELKQSSPSRGTLRTEYRCREIAQSYEAAGAVALSVLTEEDFFRGSLTDLIDARDAVSLPVLRKDFILDSYQVYESVAAGADAALLIVAILEDQELRELSQLCLKLEIAALTEVHTEEELDRALAVGAQIIGVNNRNLGTGEVSLETSFRLRPRIPSSCVTVSESGIQTAADLKRLADAEYDAALVGEHLLLADDPGRRLAQLLEGAEALASPGAPRRA